MEAAINSIPFITAMAATAFMAMLKALAPMDAKLKALAVALTTGGYLLKASRDLSVWVGSLRKRFKFSSAILFCSIQVDHPVEFK